MQPNSEAKCSQNRAERTRSSGCPRTGAQGAPGHGEHRGAGSSAGCVQCEDPGALKRSREPHRILHPTLRLCPPLSAEEQGPPAPHHALLWPWHQP